MSDMSRSSCQHQVPLLISNTLILVDSMADMPIWLVWGWWWVAFWLLWAGGRFRRVCARKHVGEGILSLFWHYPLWMILPPLAKQPCLPSWPFPYSCPLSNWADGEGTRRKQCFLSFTGGWRAIQGHVGTFQVDADVQIYLDNLKIGLGLLHFAVVSFPDNYSPPFSCLTLFTMKPCLSMCHLVLPIFSFPSCLVICSLCWSSSRFNLQVFNQGVVFVIMVYFLTILKAYHLKWERIALHFTLFANGLLIMLHRYSGCPCLRFWWLLMESICAYLLWDSFLHVWKATSNRICGWHVILLVGKYLHSLGQVGVVR